MQRLSVADAGWLLIEGRERPMHVGGLQLFEPPPDAPPSFLQDVVDQALTHEQVRPPLNRRLLRPYGLAGTYHWVEDDVELAYHLRHLALPSPARIRELLSLIGQLHANLLDRHRPLWELYLIEGLQDGRFAVYTKVHHSVMDGVAAIRQVLRSFSPDPDARGLPPPWSAALATDRDAPDGGLDPIALLGRVLRGAGARVTGAVDLTRALAGQFGRAPFDPAEVIPFQAPRSMLNVRLTAARRFVAQSYDLERVRAVGQALDGTVNDVFLAMCAGALRTYLMDHAGLPDDPLIALVPVSFRRDDSDSGNAISLVPANLATHLSDPQERFALIQRSMDRAKARLRGLAPFELMAYGLAVTAPMVAGQLTGLSGRVPPSYNLVISNVPGPDETLYWNGARMDGLYPVSLLTEGYAINITNTSYAGSMEFGIVADRRALPSVQRLIDHLEDALAELEEVAGI